MERREFVEVAGLDASISSAAETFVNSTNVVDLVERRNRFADRHHMIRGDNHYRLMVEHFADVALGVATPQHGSRDSLEDLAIVEALYASARAGGASVPVIPPA